MAPNSMSDAGASGSGTCNTINTKKEGNDEDMTKDIC